MRKERSRLFVILGLVACLTPLSTPTQAAAARDYGPLAREIFRELIEIKTTDSGVGSTPAAEAVAQRLRAAGFPEADLQVIGPSARKKNVVPRLHRSGKGQPLLIFGHLDVVEAPEEDSCAELGPVKIVERAG